MKLRLAQGSRLQDRIVLFFVFLLLAVQTASFFFIRHAIENTAQQALREDLRVGARVFQRLLQQNSQQLVEATSVLSYDLSFREAIASRRSDALAAALRGHAERIRASGMAVIAPDGVVIADTLQPANTGKPYSEPRLVARAAELGRTYAIRTIDEQVYQVVVVPVLAPLPIAWVSMMYVIDDDAARDLQRLSSNEVTFVRVTGGHGELFATTLPISRRADLALEIDRLVAQGRDGMRLTLAGEEYESLVTPLNDAGPPGLYAVLQRSVSESNTPYLGLQAALLIIAGLSLAVTLAGSIRIARRITRPLSQLAVAAREIARGNYGVRIAADGNDEIGELARSFNHMAEGLAERDTVRDVLGKVASTEVVSQLLKGEIELGGQELDATVMFTDIRNFTAICEALTPQQSLQLLNQFLTAISEVVEAHGGVVDKYLGDGVMALFGAPVGRPDDIHRAIEAALQIRHRVDALGPDLTARGLPHPQVGVGINTSHVVAGNIGSPSRLNYTVLGDGVNLASRLEGLTKRYHVPIVVGQATREGSAPGVVFRELDKVRVRGRRIPERIFEPLGHEGHLSAAEREHLDRWHEALAHYRERRFDEARQGFTALAAVRGYERLTHIYLGYLRELQAHPPAADWDAAFTLYEK